MLSKNLVLLFLLLFNIEQNFQGNVVAVIDGDTIEVIQNGKAVRVRLNGIDCPEKNQAFGSEAKKATSELVFGKVVIVKEKELDRYGRTVADVFVGDSIWVNRALVRSGMAWHYKRYSSNIELAEAETEARNEKIGLWRDIAPLPPWEFRRRN